MIGLFDSGIGGLTVVRELLRQAPQASFLYLGDTARAPYGNKTKETVEKYAIEDAKFLLDHGATSLVVACNTASALAIDALRATYPKIPIFEVITPAVEDVHKATYGKIGVIATRATIGSGVYQSKLAQKDVGISTQACPLFVPLVEEGWIEDAETKRIVKHYLYPLRSQKVDTLILGCTHYPLLAPIIGRFMGSHTKLVDSAASVIRRVLEQVSVDSEARQSYYLTDVSLHSVEIARRWLGRPVTMELAILTS